MTDLLWNHDRISLLRKVFLKLVEVCVNWWPNIQVLPLSLGSMKEVEVEDDGEDGEGGEEGGSGGGGEGGEGNEKQCWKTQRKSVSKRRYSRK